MICTMIKKCGVDNVCLISWFFRIKIFIFASVRIMSTILAIVILALGCIPCNDAKASSVAIATGESLVLPLSDAQVPEGAHSEHQDLCSPFCQCACCAVIANIAGRIAPRLRSVAIVMKQAFSSFEQRIPQGIDLPVWQPPRLV